jgi:ABC-type glycerol-3-phosphate transport system permease component
MNRRKHAFDPASILTYLVLIAFSAVQIIPFFLQLVHSLQPFDFFPEYGKLYFFPESVNLENYKIAFELAELGEGLINTLIAASMYTLISLCVVLIVGYVLGKKTFKGKKLIMIALLGTMMIPGEILMVPNYFIIIRLGWLNELKALFLPGIVNIFGIFLVKQYMNTIPDALLESADLDGASEIQKIFKVVLPLSLPIVGTYSILTFVAIWNDYLWPMIVLRTTDMFTLQLKLMQFSPMFADQRDQILRSAGLIAVLFPVIIVYVFFQRYFIESVNTTGIK